ncbi:MAG TPA: hypothetical protein PLL48_17075, partial [Novosphingobium sp.]|nr:hypothetical protein [Novosphingobium sp.]
MAELQNLAYVVIAASDLGAWRTYVETIVGAGTCEAADGALGLRLDDHPWRVLIAPGADDDMTHAGWDLGSDEELDEYVATLRANGADVVEEAAGLAAARCVTRLYSLADPNGFRHEFFTGRTGLVA